MIASLGQLHMCLSIGIDLDGIAQEFGFYACILPEDKILVVCVTGSDGGMVADLFCNKFHSVLRINKFKSLAEQRVEVGICINRNNN